MRRRTNQGPHPVEPSPEDETPAGPEATDGLGPIDEYWLGADDEYEFAAASLLTSRRRERA